MTCTLFHASKFDINTQISENRDNSYVKLLDQSRLGSGYNRMTGRSIHWADSVRNQLRCHVVFIRTTWTRRFGNGMSSRALLERDSHQDQSEK